MPQSASIRVHSRLYCFSPCSPWSILFVFPHVFKGGLQGGPSLAFHHSIRSFVGAQPLDLLKFVSQRVFVLFGEYFGSGNVYWISMETQS